MDLEIIMHVNYCEQGQTIDEMCEKAVQWGFSGIEFRRKHKTEMADDKYIEMIARSVEKTGLKKVLFGSPGPNLMTGDKETREEELEKAMRFFKLAGKRVGLSVCNTMTGPLMNPDKTVSYSDYTKHGSFIATDEQWEWAVSGFKILGALAEEIGFRFAFETHMCYLHDLPTAAKKLADLINSPAVGVNLDYDNATYFPDNPPLKETLDGLGKRLYYVHLKNSRRLKDGIQMATGLADGDINHRDYLKLLKEHGFDGPICIEAPRGGDREWYAQQDIAYIRSVIDNMA